MSGVPYVFGNATTSIPLSQLDVNFATTATLGNASVGLGNTTTTVGNLTVSNVTINGLSGGVANGVVYINSSNTATANASVLALDGNGNLGLGVTPSAWASTFKAIQVGNSAALSSYGTSETAVTTNSYYGSLQWRYINNDVSMRYVINAGGHQFQIAGSGSPNNAISYTTAMTLDNSGNLNVGQTSGGLQNSNSFSLGIDGNGFRVSHASGTSSGAVYCNFGYNGSSIGSITQSGTGNIALNGTSDRRLKSNIAQITTAQSGPIIDALKPSSFTWIADNTSDVGFIADEMQAVIPNAVLGQPNAVDAEGHPIYQQVNMTNQELIAYLVAELQSLRARLKAANIA
jgi:hypothetical protein